jgi:CP family cyanate transporter-like MFS transporter
VKTPAGALAALFLAALTLRPQVVGIAPLISDIQDDLHTSHAVAGLLGTIPVLCMGLFAPVGAYLAGRFGTNVSISAALALIGVFGIVRALAPDAWSLILLTFPVGVGMGLGTALAPLAVREHVAERPATGTGVYMTGLQLGSASSAALAVPLAAAFGGWRWALVAFSLVALGIFVTWIVLVRPRVQPGARRFRRPRLPLRSGHAWMLVAIFALMGMAYYGLNAWLPDAYTEQHGWSERSAGLLLAMMNLTAIPAAFLVPWLSERHGGRRPFLLAMSLIFTVGALGLVTLPEIGYACSLLTGISQGGMFALVMVLPLDLERSAERVASLVAMMLGLGYTISATGPFILGAVRDVTGSFDGPLWLAVGLLAAIVPLVLVLPRPRAGRAALADGSAPG